METVYSISFFVMATTAIIFAIVAITVKNVMHSVLSALISLLMTGLLFIFLGFTYLGAVQIAVCTSVMTVILIFINTMNNQNKTVAKRKNTIRIISICSAILLAIFSVYEIYKCGFLNEFSEISYIPSSIGIKEFAEQIFINEGASFVFASLAFLAAILGFGVMLAEKDVKGDRE